MKKLILIVIVALSFSFSYGQNFTEIANYKFKTKESYKAAEDKVLLCANYLFSTPSNVSEFNRSTSKQFILKWMEGTSDYTFAIDSKVMELTKGNSDLFGLFLAAMSKVVIENKEEELSNEVIYNRAEEILVNYCGNSKNKMKPSKKIKKILKSRKSKS